MGQAVPPHQVDITELVEPEAVLGSGDSWEVVGLETLVAEPHSFSQPAADPAVHQALVASGLAGGRSLSARGHHVPRRRGHNPMGTGTMGSLHSRRRWVQSNCHVARVVAQARKGWTRHCAGGLQCLRLPLCLSVPPATHRLLRGRGQA